MVSVLMDPPSSIGWPSAPTVALDFLQRVLLKRMAAVLERTAIASTSKRCGANRCNYKHGFSTSHAHYCSFPMHNSDLMVMSS